MRKTAFQRDVLKLAKAMEQGIKKTKPVRGAYISQNYLKNGKRSKVVQACAMGAAFVNGYSLKRALVEYNNVYPINDQLLKRYPALSTNLFSAVISKNDGECWARGRIVHWLRRVAEKFTDMDPLGLYEVS